MTRQFSILVLLGSLLLTHFASATPEILLDMAHRNAGEDYPASRFVEPKFLAGWGYNGQVIGSIGGIQTFDELAPGLLPEGSAERDWALQRAEELRQRVRAAHAAGIRCFAGTDMFLFPKKLIAKYKTEICDEQGRIDIDKPRTQEIFRALLRETFQRVPELDGIVVRTGEVYLQGYPYHAASGNFSEGKRQGGTAILRGEESHIELLKIFREEVCERQNKIIIYRTWSFGSANFHENPKFYLKVTDAIAPHTNLVFSIKHQKGDFHQLTVFNPTLMIGRHRQIIEVQCQREAYGKGAHPYYIGDGVINGWEEYAWLMKPGQPRGLRDVITNSLCAGVWTWSRGGGWEGPYLKNELWCELNAYVVAEFAKNPARTEADIFNEYAREKLKLSAEDAARFRELNLLSAQAVLRGQLTTLGARVNVWWARDHFFDEPDLTDFVKRGLVEKALAEKAEAVALWRRIETLARAIKFADTNTQEFVAVSATYGRIKYELIQQAWTVLLYAKQEAAQREARRQEIAAAIARYDALWAEWRQLAQQHPSCASIYKDVGFDYHPGLGAAINRYRESAAAPGQAASSPAQFAGLRNPVLSSTNDLRDPSVLKTADGYRVFYSRFNHSGSGGGANPKNWVVAESFTRDFVTFESEREISPPGCASPGDVVRWHGRWLLPYQTYPSQPTQLVFSESTNLVDWTAPKPFLTEARALPWNELRRVIDPTFVVDGETLHCWFVGSAYRTNASGEKICGNLMGHAITRDPKLERWEILTPDEPLIGFSESAPDGVENTMVFRTGEHWTMIYSEGLARQRLAVATSTNLIEWKLAGPVELPRQTWMKNKFGAPFVWREGDEWWMILMGTNPANRTCFGLLSSTDGRQWKLLEERPAAR